MAAALLIFKPDASHRLAVRNGIWRWLNAQKSLEMRGLRWFQPPANLIEDHYGFLRGRPFFPWLVDFMSALPLLVGSVEGDGSALEQLRYELGETRVHESRPGSLRERYGIFGGINCLHVSDSVESGQQETELWSRFVPLQGIEFEGDGPADTPEHTFHLRSLANQVANNVYADVASLEMQKLLKEETDLEGDRFEALSRVILGALV